MKTYIDTSVILSAYKPNESYHEASLRVSRLDEVTKLGSHILIAELISVTSRLCKTSQIKLPGSVERILSRLSMRERIYALVNAIILDWNISCPNLGFEVKQLKLKDFSLSMPENIFEASMMAPALGLKTLDLMHIACAKMIREVSPDLKYFVTLDQNILDSKDEIKASAGFQPVTPQELVDLV